MKALNITAVVLLSTIALGVFTVPKFNYGILVSRQNAFEIRLNTVQERLGKIDPLSGPKEGERVAVLEVIDQVPGALGEVSSRLAALSEEQSALHGELADQRSRLEGLEGAAKPASRAQPSQVPALPGGSYTEAIRLPDDLTRKAARFPPRATSDTKLEDFLGAAIEAGLLALEHPGQVSPEGMERLGQIFELFKLNMSMVQLEQDLYIRREVEKRTISGDFVELPDDSKPVTLELQPDEVGIQFVKLLDPGVKRVFWFPLEDYPEINTYNELRDNVRDHLIRDVANIPESLLKGT